MDEKNPWWSQLRQSGMIISPTVLNEFLKDGPVEYDEYAYSRLRDGHNRYKTWLGTKKEDDKTGLAVLIDSIFEQFLKIPTNWVKKNQDISEKFRTRTITGESLRPDRVVLHVGLEGEPRLLVKFDHGSTRVGMNRGRREYSKFLTLLRETNVSVGIITNGSQIRLAFAGLDHDCWVEWEIDRWFEDEEGKQQLRGFLSLLGHTGLSKSEDEKYPLLSLIKRSRERQGELSQVLGEQTREAVEQLISSLDRSIRTNDQLLNILRKDPASGRELTEDEIHEALYQSSIRIIMRIVVTLFAESRELLPRGQDIYHGSYGIDGLYEQLSRANTIEGEEGLDDRKHSWPRLLSLFRVVYEGSDHKDLSVQHYGGILFKKGDPKSSDPVLRTLHIFEDESVDISDNVLFNILKKLKIGKVRTRFGRSSKWVSGPVDFSQLRTEYIGMMYEGLLDYRLRSVSHEDEAIVFLNIGQEPALPFSLLKKMEDRELTSLISKLGKVEKSGPETEDEGEEEPEEVTEEDREEENEYAEEEDVKRNSTDAKQIEIMNWARKAVILSGNVKQQKGRNANISQYERDVEKAAGNLIKRIVHEGEMYLIRASGTRKGTGTFYTKPQLAVPTVHRTLEPLVYVVEGEGEERKLTPRTPEEILSLKVCDPAMGSGSFLVGALNYLTEGLFKSLEFHKGISDRNGDKVITLPYGETSKAQLPEILVPFRIDDENYEIGIKIILRRLIVEKCIFGVDINPLAVELAKLSLWVETMDKDLPFEFLDHKLKVGNSLVGCWLDRFQDYPIMAWMREGGDKTHDPVHFEKGAWTNRIKDVLNSRVKPELVRIINGMTRLDDYLFADQEKVVKVHNKAISLSEEFHNLPLWGDGFEQREQFFQERIRSDNELNELRNAFDLWCSIWFWPGDWLDDDSPTPENFYRPSERIKQRVKEIANEQRFFHWELEFPEVFVKGKGGFDAVVGNPPWETLQPVSKEFFTKYDPIFRTRGKQDAIDVQKDIFTKSKEIEREWLLYNSDFKSMGNIMQYFAYPWGDTADESKCGKKISFERGKAGELINNRWRSIRSKRIGYSDPHHTFRYQGEGKAYTYKLFLEMGHSLLKNKGRMGFIVPSGVYTDKGTTTLRELFIDRSRWEWIFGFENKRGIFDIHRSYKFCPIVVEKGSNTEAIKAAFMRHDLSDWEKPYGHIIRYTKNQVLKFSPKSKAILEIRTMRDLEILEKIYSNSVLLGDQSPDGWQIKYAQGDFNMTSDSHLFPPRTWWEEKGYRPDQYGRWLPPEGEKPELIYKGKEIGPPGDIGLPLYQGGMINLFDPLSAYYGGGSGHSINWVHQSWDSKIVMPQYIMSSKIAINRIMSDIRILYRYIGSDTNTRTMISSIGFKWPCGHTIGVLNLNEPFKLISILNSFVFDWQIRTGFSGNGAGAMDPNKIGQRAVLYTKNIPKVIEKFVIQINTPIIMFSPIWLVKKNIFNIKPWKSCWATTEFERKRLYISIDSIISKLYGLNYLDFKWILRNDTSDPKGFWRVDKDKPQELRYTTLTLVAFRDLEKMIEQNGGDVEKGIEAFCEQNDGEGWMIPEKIRFIQREDGTLDFDTPDSVEYEVRSKLGPRFYDWQLEGTPEESWKECEMHARAILGDEVFEKMINDETIVKNDRQLIEKKQYNIEYWQL